MYRAVATAVSLPSLTFPSLPMPGTDRSQMTDLIAWEYRIRVPVAKSAALCAHHAASTVLIVSLLDKVSRAPVANASASSSRSSAASLSVSAAAAVSADRPRACTRRGLPSTVPR